MDICALKKKSDDSKNKKISTPYWHLYQDGFGQCFEGTMVGYSNSISDYVRLFLDPFDLVDHRGIDRIWPLCTVLGDSIHWRYADGAKQGDIRQDGL